MVLKIFRMIFENDIVEKQKAETLKNIKNSKRKTEKAKRLSITEKKQTTAGWGVLREK